MPKSFRVIVACEVTKLLIVEDCDREDAWNDPWKYVIEETETEMKEKLKDMHEK